jgi:hypothetical protein
LRAGAAFAVVFLPVVALAVLRPPGRTAIAWARGAVVVGSSVLTGADPLVCVQSSPGSWKQTLLPRPFRLVQGVVIPTGMRPVPAYPSAARMR